MTILEKEVWERILETTSKMLEVVRERNILSKESSAIEKEYRQKEDAYQKILQDLENFQTIWTDEDVKNIIDALIYVIRDKFNSYAQEVALYLEKFEEAGRLTYEIEVYKESLTSFTSFYRILKLKEKEIPRERLYELVVLILLANENDDSISETQFFESKEVFHEMLKNSGDPILNELLDGTSITGSILLDLFLEKVK